MKIIWNKLNKSGQKKKREEKKLKEYANIGGVDPNWGGWSAVIWPNRSLACLTFSVHVCMVD